MADMLGGEGATPLLLNTEGSGEGRGEDQGFTVVPPVLLSGDSACSAPVIVSRDHLLTDDTRTHARTRGHTHKRSLVFLEKFFQLLSLDMVAESLVGRRLTGQICMSLVSSGGNPLELV